MTRDVVGRALLFGALCEVRGNTCLAACTELQEVVDLRYRLVVADDVPQTVTRHNHIVLVTVEVNAGQVGVSTDDRFIIDVLITS